ncbi:MAG: PhnD/SsuA/transferrin family substrate-binding protein, partial [Gemmobacter sp.]
WETLAEVEPGLTSRTRVVARSEWLGFPPFVARTDRRDEPGVLAFRRAILGLAASDDGIAALRLLRLDGVAAPTPGLYDGIAARMAALRKLR